MKDAFNFFIKLARQQHALVAKMMFLLICVGLHVGKVIWTSCPKIKIHTHTPVSGEISHCGDKNTPLHNRMLPRSGILGKYVTSHNMVLAHYLQLLVDTSVDVYNISVK